MKKLAILSVCFFCLSVQVVEAGPIRNFIQRITHPFQHRHAQSSCGQSSTGGCSTCSGQPSNGGCATCSQQPAAGDGYVNRSVVSTPATAPSAPVWKCNGSQCIRVR